MARLLLETASAWEKEGIAYGEIRPVIGAADETCLQRMMLVFMDLATGYLLMEEVAGDRCFETWYGAGQAGAHGSGLPEHLGCVSPGP